MIKMDVKSLLPHAYDVDSARWYDLIRKDYDRYRYRILLISFLVTVNIPLIFLINELLHKRTELFVNYIVPLAVMLFMLIYLIVFKNIAVMRVIAAFTAITGFFCAILLPGGHDTYIIIFLNFIPLIFSLYGLRGSAAWFFLFAVSLSGLAIFHYVLLDGTLTVYLSTENVPVALFSLLIMFLFLYAGQRQHEKIIKKLIRSIAYDPVTGLPNKDSFIKCMRGMEDSLIAILHITNFKNLATLFGYEFSDRILVDVTETLSGLSSELGFGLYKLNWHEFGLQIPLNGSLEPEYSEQLLSRILNSLRNRKIKMDNMDVNLAISIGGVIICGRDYNTALSKADSALDYGLSRHRNISLYIDGMDVKAEVYDRVKKYSILHDNIINKTLKMYLQPVVDSQTGEICWYEALLRLKGENGGIESIYRYIDIARDTDLYPLLTGYMFEQVEKIIRQTGIPVSINISLQDIMSGAVINNIERISGESSYSAGTLILEIVENDEFCDIDECIAFIKKVQSMGVHVAIDDFGSGYSNIANLLKLNLDIVKIDGELIKRIEHDNEAYLFIKTIYDFCCNAGYKVVAEYTENETILRKIREIGIEFCQGYFFGRPDSPEKFSGFSEIYPMSEY
ncbi:MAG TPA: EAL domain-containing protein [Spirochaetota bacterium]|nr:EAL domain-containing protein [Spirochaetota bacterium]HPJ34123.1 EAL domain-containing protein [Spirochaetota bacterium]